ncbi:MAG: type II toxin-antitoxin system RelE/ParE family toxin [Thermomicrobiales bacterium]
MSNREVRLTAAARKDFRAILRYTGLEWGSEQRDRYGLLIEKGFARIAEFPELGESQIELGVGGRAIRIEMHVVYYRATPKTIRILRIRHVRAAILGLEDL